MSHELTLQRRTLLKTSGALVVNFSFMPLSVHAQELQSEAGPPDPNQLDSWIAIHSDNTATIYIGFVELGQGCSTSLLQVAAEELDLSMDQVEGVSQDTDITPNQGGTYSSSAIRVGRPQVQRAAAEARASLLQMASARVQLPVDRLFVENGLISSTGDDNVFITYGELIGDQLFELQISGTADLKAPGDYKIVAREVPRRDISLKASGNYDFIQNLNLPGMLHARIIRPRGQGAYKDGINIDSIDEQSIDHLEGVSIIRKNNFLAVAAESEWEAIQAAQQLKVNWQQPENLPANSGLFSSMVNGPVNDRVAVDEGDISVFEQATYRSTFDATGPYQSHAPFAPNCALADIKEDSGLVLCSSQDIYNTRTSIAALLGIQENRLRVRYHESAGTFGHSCWDDVAQAAAIVSKELKQPVRLQFMRWDEHGWDTYGPAHVGKARVSADAQGRLLSYEYEGWQHHWSLIESSQQAAKGTPAAEWPAFPAQQINPRTLGGMYDVANRKLLNHHVPGTDYLKGAWLRSPMDLSFAFVSEQAIDDLAFQANMDSFEFRRLNISEYHWLGVLEAAASAANWEAHPSATRLADDDIVQGRGIGLGTHLASWGAAVAELEINRQTGKVRILRLVAAIDAGLVVNPGIVKRQITGQLAQTASRMLFEEVTFNTSHVTSLDWNSYPILRFEDCPELVPVIVQRMDEPSSGAGEEVMAAAAAAIANAFFDATGKRMSMYPFTPERVLQVLDT